jgi:hypothetical protein
VVVVLTPSHLTRPNCVRELRWALDWSQFFFVIVDLQGAADKTVALAGCADGLVERAVDAVKELLVGTATRERVRADGRP